MRNLTSSSWRLTSRLGAVCAGVGATLALWAALVLGQTLEREAERVAETYLRALLCGDRETALALSPTKPENKFGPCPFAQMPRLGSARVDAHRAAVAFAGGGPPFDKLRAGSAGRALEAWGAPSMGGPSVEGPRNPRGLQDRAPIRREEFAGSTGPRAQGGAGAVLLTRLDQVKGNPWRVRQVAFFTQPPLGMRIPSRSVTRADIAQEPLAQAAARRYIAAWLKGDYRTMQHLAFDWLSRLRPPPYSVGIRSIELTSAPAPNAEVRVNFTANVTLFRALPRQVQGAVFAMREDGQWKIRANELTL